MDVYGNGGGDGHWAMVSVQSVHEAAAAFDENMQVVAWNEATTTPAFPQESQPVATEWTATILPVEASTIGAPEVPP